MNKIRFLLIPFFVLTLISCGTKKDKTSIFIKRIKEVGIYYECEKISYESLNNLESSNQYVYYTSPKKMIPFNLENVNSQVPSIINLLYPSKYDIDNSLDTLIFTFEEDEIIEIKVSLDEIYGYVGSKYYRNAKYDDAVDILTLAIKYNKYKTNHYFNRGAAYLKNKKYDKSSKDFNKVLELDMNHEEAKIGLERLATLNKHQTD